MEKYERQIAQQVKFDVKEQEVATMVVNGVQQGSRIAKQVVITCPSCGEIIMTFQEGVSVLDIYKELAIQDTTNFPKFCPRCGQRIMCDKRVVSEQ